MSAGALLALGAADLVFLNVWVYPRTSMADRLARLTAPASRAATSAEVTAAPAGVAVDRAAAPAAPGIAPAEQPPAPEPIPGSEAPLVPDPEATARPVLTRLARAGEPVLVYFGHNQHVLAPEASRSLAALARNRGSARILVEGHADRTGVEAYNEWLSQERAAAVADALVALGFARERLVVRGFGSRRPAPEGGSMRRNRRVEISVIGEVIGEP
jgi:outer membrane protein OmpA-like peptidoglycan-associated protein